ncbi:MAG TPA: MarP family serine protease [Candidatus Dormibacteraeota bacterium]|nr:MarP family serine protease [Candidatus Dormibacteraeota bacterium]
MLVDILIIIFAFSALLRGRDIGFVRQIGSTAGFFGGLFLGAWLEPHTVNLAHSQTSRVVVTLVTTLGCALILLSVGEYLGIKIKQRVRGRLKRVNNLDNGLGALLGTVSLLLTAWLIAAVVSTLPFPSLQSALRDSSILSTLNKKLPAAPVLIAGLGHLIDPNGFPQVFIGSEPSPPSSVNKPSYGALQAAINSDRASVVKVEGQGCGGIIEGSGFVVGPKEVATNAHVVAGIRWPYVQDGNGTHGATVIWFDPSLDFAVLRVNNLAGRPLTVSNNQVSAGTPAAVLGYPGGGPFTADPAAVLEEFTATGRDIYGHGNTNRNVYEVKADVMPGNSGGPLVAKDGTVIGVVFARSSTYQQFGYALTTDQIKSDIGQATARNRYVGTGQCAE